MHLTSIQLLNLASHLHLGLETGDSFPSRSQNLCLNSIQLPRLPSQFHPGHISPPSRSQNLHLTTIHVPRFAGSNLNSIQVKLFSIQVLRLAFCPYPCPESCITTPPRSYLNSIELPTCFSTTSMAHRTCIIWLACYPIHVLRFA